MRWLAQTFAVLALNIRTIPARLSSSAVAIIGIAGVVVVFVSVLSIAAGFAAAMEGSGSPDRAPGIRREGQTALAAAELMVIIDLPKKASPDAPANVPVRGIEPASLTIREE